MKKNYSHDFQFEVLMEYSRLRISYDYLHALYAQHTDPLNCMSIGFNKQALEMAKAEQATIPAPPSVAAQFAQQQSQQQANAMVPNTGRGEIYS